MTYKLQLALAALLSGTQLTHAAYSLVKTYKGESFFNDWTYYGSYDNLTNGDIVWVDRNTADNQPKLTYINSAGNAIIKVDNTTVVPYNEKRNSVRLTSNDKIGLGTLLVFDAVHVPYGCSVWGALWTKAVGDLWPAGGEIDIFEAVNLMSQNQMALHTVAGCNQAEGIAQTGTTNVRNCDNQGSNGAGCTVLDPSPNSYGAPFAAAGGGVWVTEFADTGVNIWFFTRGDVPSSLATDSVDVASLGTPTAAYPSSSCNPSQFFKEQEIVIDITLCGDWAGVKSVLESTCPALNGTNTCYTTYVLDPKNYDTAYFEMSSVKLFASSPSAVSLAPSSTQTSSTGSGGNGGGSGNGANGAVDRLWSVYAGALAVFVASAAVGTATLSF